MDSRTPLHNEINLLLTLVKDSNNLELAKELLSKCKILDDKGCWILRDDWSSYTSFKGLSAHRLSYKLFKGKTPINCLHSCDRKGCINPEHLFCGTDSINQFDARTKRATLDIINSTKFKSKREYDRKTLNIPGYDGTIKC